MRNKWFMALNLTLLVAGLSGCQSVITLPTGDKSVMNADQNKLWSSLATTPTRPPSGLAYKAKVSCRYMLGGKSANGKSNDNSVTMSVQQLHDRLRVTAVSPSDISTALISSSGKLYDYNIQNADDSTRDSPENFDEHARKELKELRQSSTSGADTTHVINQFTLIVPEFSEPFPSPGQVVGYVTAEQGKTWAAYTYRGVASVNGSVGAVLGLSRTPESAPELGPVLVGFDVVDLRTNLPLILELNAGSVVDLRLQSCQ